MEEPTIPNTPTFVEIYIQSYYGHYGCKWLADTSGVPFETVQMMLSGQPVARDQAERVLHSIKYYQGKLVTLETSTIPVLPDSQPGTDEEEVNYA